MVSNYNSDPSNISFPISGSAPARTQTKPTIYIKKLNLGKRPIGSDHNKESFRFTEEELRKQIGDKKVDDIIRNGKFDVIDEEWGDDSEFDSEEDMETYRELVKARRSELSQLFYDAFGVSYTPDTACYQRQEYSHKDANSNSYNNSSNNNSTRTRQQQRQSANGGNGDGKVNGDGNGKGKKDSAVRTHSVYKYSKDIPLAEEIMLGYKPTFLQIKDGEPVTSDVLDFSKERNIILKPHDATNQVVIPYIFKDIEEIKYFIGLAKEKSIYDLFLMSESLWKQLLIAKNEHIITFFTIDTIYSYFQDLFPTTHYDMIIGAPGAGKGAILV